MKYTGYCISDIHFGSIDPKVLKEELVEVFIKTLLSAKKIDYIIMDGDLFDHKTYLNDKISDYALGFMDTIVSIAKDHKCPIRLIYGTESHEVSQYNIFSIYETDPDIDFKVIYTVQEEELLPNMKVLYIPEEYVYSKKEYYEKFLNKKDEYNYIFGHGVIQEVMTMAVKHTSSKKENARKKCPYFTTAELTGMCKGQTYFGHYHINTNIQDKVFYVGSFTRWQFGEEAPKGFYEITYDIDKDKYSNRFIENEYAKKYTTYTYSYDDSVMLSEDELISELNKKDKLTEASATENVRYIFNIPENHPNPEFIIKVLNERYKFNDFIKVKIVNGYVDKKRKVNKERLNDILSEYPMIFDKSISLEDKIYYFIKKRDEKEVPVENIKKYLYGENINGDED